MKEIKSIILLHLRNDEHYQFHKKTLELIDEIGADKLHITTKLTAYSEAHKTEGDILRVIRGSEKTGTIESADAERDAIISGLFQNIKSNQNRPDEAKKQAVAKLLPILKTYKDVTRLNYNAESAAVSALVNDLQADELKDMLVLLGVTEWVQELAAKNNEFNSQWGSRADDEAVKATLSRMKEVRPAVDEAYRELRKYINSWVVVNEPTPEAFTSFISRQNSRIDEYKLLLKKRRGGGEDEEEPPVGGRVGR